MLERGSKIGRKSRARYKGVGGARGSGGLQC